MARKPAKDPKKAADDAANRSKNKKTNDAVQAPAKTSRAVAAAKKNPDMDREAQALFLHHLKKLGGPQGLIKAKDDAVTAIRNAYKTAKADGFLKGDFDVAFAIQKADGEKKKKAAIARELTIAKWLGCDLGSQLDLFLEDARVPAADRAYDEGVAASMKSEVAKPDYHPATEQYRKYMEGYHADQERQLKKGITKLPEAVEEDVKATAAKNTKVAEQKGADAKEFEGKAPADPVTSGVAMTRSQHEALKTGSKPH
jgi:hypothetical protein